MDRDEGLSNRIGKCLGLGDPDQKGPHKPGPGGHGDSVQRGEIQPGLRERKLYHLIDLLQMLSRCDLRDDAAVLCVHRDLGGDHVG